MGVGCNIVLILYLWCLTAGNVKTIPQKEPSTVYSSLFVCVTAFHIEVHSASIYIVVTYVTSTFHISAFLNNAQCTVTVHFPYKSAFHSSLI